MFRTNLVLASVLALASTTAFAGLSPIKSTDESAMKASRIANDVHTVEYVAAGDLTYKIVQMDSGLNGSIGSTIIVHVGEQVGGVAGYEAAFVLGPKVLQGILEVKAKGSSVEVTGIRDYLESVQPTKLLIKYDARTGELSVK